MKARHAAFTGMICLFLFTSFYPDNPEPAPPGACTGPQVFYGYTFLYPEIINKNAAYAPFFVKWDDYYQKVYFDADPQRQENIAEWVERFCGQPQPEDVAYVVYEASYSELNELRQAAADKQKRTLLPISMEGNSLAALIAINNCTEVVDYLMFTRKCAPYVESRGDQWSLPRINAGAMQELIEEGKGRFAETRSHFVRLRYAYQIVRLAHYARQWTQTVTLYNELIPKVDRKKPSIISFWALGHLAGALQKLGKYPEAAYRFSLIFRHCSSKRAQAFRSFLIRNDADWNACLKLCQSDAEKSTLYMLRSGADRRYAVDDMKTVYQLDPENPQLDLLLVSAVQELEKIYLRTRVTDIRKGAAYGALQRQVAARQLLDLTDFVRNVVQENRSPNQKLWQCMSGYLEMLAGDQYAAEKTFKRAEARFNNSDAYDRQLAKQLEIWRLLQAILNINPATGFPDEEAFRIQSYAVFNENPNFKPFLQDWLSAAYAALNHPGKAFLAAYDPAALGYNPNLEVLDDLLREASKNNPVFLEKAMLLDTNPAGIQARLLEIKGTYLMSIGENEAALASFRAIQPTALASLPKFYPFKEITDERINRPLSDSLYLNRKEIAEQIIEFEFRAKAAAAERAPVAAWYYYLIGVGYYNMSYFGTEWEALDFYRSGANWLRLATGPVFPLVGAPAGNRENTDLSLALSNFEKALAAAQNPELAARAAFMAARCQQKQWFCSPTCTYHPGNKLIPQLPNAYNTYYDLMRKHFWGTDFYSQMVKECKWFAAYMR
ncbi:MAG: hypothetical protein KGS48_02935 [Bacteroidetes bacterium]|nr:hypothetical protein [Bacteroidota bacterium]